MYLVDYCVLWVSQQLLVANLVELNHLDQTYNYDEPLGSPQYAVESSKQQNTQYYAVGRNSGGRAQATHTYGARPTESRKLMASAACIIEVASANTMAEDMAALGGVLVRAGRRVP